MNHKIVEVVPHVPTSKTRVQVERAIACGLTPDEVAYLMQCTLHEIRTHYQYELEHGLTLVSGKVGGSLLKQALRGDVNAAKFWLQTRARWVPASHVEVTGKDGGAIQVEEKQKLVDSILSMVAASQQGEAQAEVAKVQAAGSKLN